MITLQRLLKNDHHINGLKKTKEETNGKCN